MPFLGTGHYGAFGYYAAGPSPRRLRVYQAFLEVPEFGRRLRVYQAELEVPDAPRRLRVYQAFLQVPEFDRRLRVHQAHLTVPSRITGSAGPLVADEEEVLAFARTLKVVRASEFTVPRGKSSWSHTGKGQFRASFAAGRTWEEEYEPALMTDPRLRSFMAYLNDIEQNERVFEIAHPHLTSALGTATGTAAVAGAGQTGFAITSTGWTGTLLRGDIIRVSGLNHVMEVQADTTGPGGGTVAIPVSPGILVGGSPADGAEIFYGGDVLIRAKIDDIADVPDVDGDQIYLGLRVRFREAP